MKKNLFLIIAFVAATLLFSSCSNSKPEKEVNDFRIKRGTNISHWLSQSEERGEARLKHIQEDDFERLEQPGAMMPTSASGISKSMIIRIKDWSIS